MSKPFEHLTRFYVTLDGAAPEAEFLEALGQVRIERSLHQPDLAVLEVRDRDLRWVDDPRLLPGAALTLTVQVSGREVVVFDGEIVELEPVFGSDAPLITLRALDRLHRLGLGRRVRSFKDLTDSDLARTLAQEVGLNAQVAGTSSIRPFLLQRNESNLTLLRRVAQDSGHLLYVEGETLYFEPVDGPSDPIEVQWGRELVEFRPRISALGQCERVRVRGWDPMRAEAIEGEAQAQSTTARIGEPLVGGRLVAERFGVTTERLVSTSAVSDPKRAQRIAAASGQAYEGEAVEAEGILQGLPEIDAGSWIRVSGIGRRFEGDYLVTRVEHDYGPARGLSTRFQVSGWRRGGLAGLFGERQDAERLVGARVAVVTDNRDPEGLGRVKLRYPWLTLEHTSDWARVLGQGAGPGRGLQCLPEIHDEVLVTFEFGDIHSPVVVGGLWNGQARPPIPNDTESETPEGKSARRILRSRMGHALVLDDSQESPGITLRTAEGDKLQLGHLGEGEGLTLVDSAGNGLRILSGGGELQLEVQGNATLKAGGSLRLQAPKIELEAQGALSLSAKGALDLRGAKVSLSSDTLVQIQGKAGARVSGGGGPLALSGSAVLFG